MIRYLLDTDTCIYLLKGVAKKAVLKIETFSPGSIAISSITVAELLYGAEKSQQQERNKSSVEKFISPLVILPFDHTAAAHYGRIRAYLEKKGNVIGQMDMLIASIALAHGVTVITNNTREFKRVQFLKVENWL
jgi:tRNA(fMet)-specific endonuclease VapC